MDATIIHAPSSTKNQDKKRNLEMSSTKKGNRWSFGLKAHISLNSQRGFFSGITDGNCPKWTNTGGFEKRQAISMFSEVPLGVRFRKIFSKFYVLKL